MIERTTGDILRADVEALVNPVNCVGVMGRGLALQFRTLFPENFAFYKILCDQGEVQPGRMTVYERSGLGNPRFIINFPTKTHWKKKSRIEYIESGLVALQAEIRQRSIASIAIPSLGAGLGGLRWTDVLPVIERAFAEMPEVRALLFEPHEQPEQTSIEKTKDS